MPRPKTYELYNRYDSVEQIPADEREKLERQVFQRDINSIWQDTVKFFTERDRPRSSAPPTIPSARWRSSSAGI